MDLFLFLIDYIYIHDKSSINCRCRQCLSNGNISYKHKCNTMIFNILHPSFKKQLFVGGLMSYLGYLCLFPYSDVQHILCGVFLFSLSPSCVPSATSFYGLSFTPGYWWGPFCSSFGFLFWVVFFFFFFSFFPHLFFLILSLSWLQSYCNWNSIYLIDSYDCQSSAFDSTLCNKKSVFFWGKSSFFIINKTDRSIDELFIFALIFTHDNNF